MNIDTLINNPTAFSIYVETMAKRSGTTLLDMLLHVCEEGNVDYSSINKIISQSLKDKLHKEALDYNLLKEKNTYIDLENFCE